jgi:hypothetical protein
MSLERFVKILEIVVQPEQVASYGDHCRVTDLVIFQVDP